MVKVSPEVKKNPLKNKAYSSILFNLAREENNSFGLASIFKGTKIKKTQGIIYRQLSFLCDPKVNLIISSQKKKGAYRINWEQIVKEYMLYCINIDKLKKLKEKYTKNKVIQSIFQELFLEFLKRNKYPAIEEIFSDLSCSVLTDISINKDAESFCLEFTQQVYHDSDFEEITEIIIDKLTNQS